MIDLDACEFGAATPKRETEQHEGTIAERDRPVATFHSLRQEFDSLVIRRRSTALFRREGLVSALERAPHQLTIGWVDKIRVPGGAADRSKAATQRTLRFASIDSIGDIRDDR